MVDIYIHIYILAESTLVNVLGHGNWFSEDSLSCLCKLYKYMYRKFMYSLYLMMISLNYELLLNAERLLL